MKRLLKPVLVGDYWLTGGSPDLTGIIPEGAPPTEEHGGSQACEVNGCVDHHVFQDNDGLWHMWGCVRKTSVGRILYHWTTPSLMEANWLQTGEIIRCDHTKGESVEGRVEYTSEMMQSPFIIKENGLFYYFFGGHTTMMRTTPLWADACQMCLMTSEDGVAWKRHENKAKFSRVFVGPGEVRDPCLIKIGNLWYCYYAGFYGDTEENAAFFVRTSKNLVDWSEWTKVHEDSSYGAGRWDTECPFVTYKDGYYYLFRTIDYYSGNTAVFRSEDPMDFGIGNASDKYVCNIFCAAPEIIIDENGNEFMSSSHDPVIGNYMSKMEWREDA